MASAGFILQIDTASSDEEPKAQTRCLHDCTQAPLALKSLPNLDPARSPPTRPRGGQI